jgi:glycerol 3-phosphatase-1
MPEVFITADVVKTGKPSPEGYLLGRERLTVSGPNHTVVVFEDAVAGVKAGKAAGAIVVAVLETHGREQLLKAGADYVVDGLHQVQVVNMEGNSTRIALNVQEKKSESNGI